MMQRIDRIMSVDIYIPRLSAAAEWPDLRFLSPAVDQGPAGRWPERAVGPTVADRICCHDRT